MHFGVNTDIGRVRIAYRQYYFLRRNFYRPLVVDGVDYQIGGAALTSYHFSVGFFLRRRYPNQRAHDRFDN